jgi:DNA-binding response OmpR family regulator
MIQVSPSSVLIADGDTVLRRQLSNRLLDFEIASDCVADGAAAIAHLDAHPYAIVVLDMALERPDAWRVLDRVRALPPLQRPVVLVLVTNQEARSLDVNVVQVVLRKPVRIGEVTELVRVCLRTIGDDTAMRRQRSKPAPRSAAIEQSTDLAGTST